MKKKKALFIVATQYDNVGDLLINRCLIQEVSKHCTVYLDTKNVPRSFVKHLLVNSEIQELSTVTDISLKGKGAILLPVYRRFNFDYLFKSPGPFGDIKTFNAYLKNLFFWWIFKAMNYRSCKSYLIGSDLVLNSEYDRKFHRLLSSQVEMSFVRSDRNIELLNAQGIKNVAYIPDMCFLMSQYVTKSVNKKKVGVSFRDLENPLLNEKLLILVKTFISYHLSEGFEVVIFHQVERDSEFNSFLYESCKDLGVISLRQDNLGFDEIAFYNDMYSVVSNRLHVLLLAQMFGTIPIAMLDDHAKTSKIHNIYDSIGLSELVFTDPKEFEPDKIYKEADLLVAKIESINTAQCQLASDIILKVVSDK